MSVLAPLPPPQSLLRANPAPEPYPGTPAWGRLMAPGQAPQPWRVTRIEVSGDSWDPVQRQWVAIDRARLDPSRTQLDSFCTCGIRWHVDHLE